mmetsp:Transcript_16654/g.25227  ORF Transcript_16654/g.25227 Transcript_16654/m.25227 type:complete len:91 (+) Transcript_16654:1527-1799(+)
MQSQKLITYNTEHTSKWQVTTSEYCLFFPGQVRQQRRLRWEVGRYCTSSIGRLQTETLGSKHACRSNNEKLHSLRQSQGMGYRRRKLLKT